MISRRDFIVSGTLATLSPCLHAASSTLELPHLPYHSLIYDDRFEEAVAFGRAAVDAGLPVSAIRGDVTALWYHNLYHRWLADRAPIAGMTTPDALFCLETLGNDAGLRLAMRVDHHLREGGIEHRLLAPRKLATEVRPELLASDLSRHMLDLVRVCPASWRDRVSRTMATPLVGVGSGRPALVTWVLAPYARRMHA
jgi:hypothetical protein